MEDLHEVCVLLCLWREASFYVFFFLVVSIWIKLFFCTRPTFFTKKECVGFLDLVIYTFFSETRVFFFFGSFKEFLKTIQLYLSFNLCMKCVPKYQFSHYSIRYLVLFFLIFLNLILDTFYKHQWEVSVCVKFWLFFF